MSMMQAGMGDDLAIVHVAAEHIINGAGMAAPLPKKCAIAAKCRLLYPPAGRGNLFKRIWSRMR